MGISVILTSHVRFAEEALKTAEMIIGNKQQNVKVVSVTEGRTFESCLEEMQETYEDLRKNSEGVLILADIFGGTPANISSYLVLSEKMYKFIRALTFQFCLKFLY